MVWVKWDQFEPILSHPSTKLNIRYLNSLSFLLWENLLDWDIPPLWVDIFTHVGVTNDSDGKVHWEQPENSWCLTSTSNGHNWT